MKHKNYLIFLLIAVFSSAQSYAQTNLEEKPAVYMERLSLEIVKAKQIAAMQAAIDAGQISPDWDPAYFDSKDQKWLDRYKAKLAARTTATVDVDSLLNSPNKGHYDYLIRLSFYLEVFKGKKTESVAILRQYDLYNDQGKKVKTVSEKELFKQFKKRKSTT